MSGAFVLDASVTFAWCFADQGDDQTDALLDQLAAHRARVPTLWCLEVANVLVGAERRGQLTPAASARFLALLAALPIDVDDATASRALRETLGLARAHRLSAYDAAYLELALRDGLPLATRDGQLAAVARELGVAVL